MTLPAPLDFLTYLLWGCTKGRHFRRLSAWHCPRASLVAEHSSQYDVSATSLGRIPVHTSQNTAKRGQVPV